MQLSRQLDASMVLVAPTVARRDELFTRFGQLFADAALVASADVVVERLLEREAILSTGIGHGVAVPHAQIPDLGRLAIAASTHRSPAGRPRVDSMCASTWSPSES